MKWVREHSLSLVISCIILCQTALSLWTGHHFWLTNVEQEPFLRWWLHEYNMSIVADSFGILLIVLLTKRLREVNSEEGKD